MTPTIVRPLGVAALALLAAAGLVGCQAQSVHHHPPHGPVAAAPWYPHDYFYYPGVQVYFHIHSGTYWYHERGHWRRAHQLPPHIVILPRDRVRIRVDRGEPWRDHHRHAERYRPHVPPRHEQLHERNRIEREHNRRLYHEHGERREREHDRYCR